MRHKAVVSRCFTRVAAQSVRAYARTLASVFTADCAMLIERFIHQAVGYSDKGMLVVQTQLFRDAPPFVITAFSYLGVQRALAYAREERSGAEARVSSIASLLAIVWHQFPTSFDGRHLLRTIEEALRMKCRSSVVFAVSILKAIFHHMLEHKLEHEENLNSAQIRALSCGWWTRWYAGGSADSFWGNWNSISTPATLQRNRQLLRAELLRSLDDSEASGGASKQPLVGQRILQHFCELFSQLWHLYEDLPGQIETVLLLTAEDYDSIGDIIWELAEMMTDDESTFRKPSAKASAMPCAIDWPLEAVLRAAPLHIAVKLHYQLSTKACPSSREVVKQVVYTEAKLVSEDAVPFELYALFWQTTSHDLMEPLPIESYTTAKAAAQKFALHADELAAQKTVAKCGAHPTTTTTQTALGRVGGPPLPLPRSVQSGSGIVRIGTLSSGAAQPAKAAPPPKDTYHRHHLQLIDEERSDHEKAIKACREAASRLLNEWLAGGASTTLVDPLSFVHHCMLPRSRISHDDAQHAVHFVALLISISSGKGNWLWKEVLQTFVTEACTVLIAYTPAEASRVGVALSDAISLLSSLTEKEAATSWSSSLKAKMAASNIRKWIIFLGAAPSSVGAPPA